MNPGPKPSAATLRQVLKRRCAFTNLGLRPDFKGVARGFSIYWMFA